jgi:hypothetical protein
VQLCALQDVSRCSLTGPRQVFLLLAAAVLFVACLSLTGLPSSSEDAIGPDYGGFAFRATLL